MTRFDRLLHDTIDEMALELKGPSAALVTASIAHGRRIRRRRRLAVTGGALLALAALSLPWALLPRRSAAPAPATSASARAPASPAASAAAARSGLPGGWVVAGAGTRMLDRATGAYTELARPPAGVFPSPLGDRALLVESTPGDLIVTDAHGRHPVPVVAGADLGEQFEWSPAGDRLVGRVQQKEPFKIGFALIDPRTGGVTRLWIDHDKYDCSVCAFGWTRDGREIVMAIADRSGGEAAERIARLQLFDPATGAPTRSLPIRAMPTSPYSWSPDGRYVVAGATGLGSDWQLVEVATGTARPYPYDAVWMSDTQLLAAHDGNALTLTPEGNTTASTSLPADGFPITLGPPG